VDGGTQLPEVLPVRTVELVVQSGRGSRCQSGGDSRGEGCRQKGRDDGRIPTTGSGQAEDEEEDEEAGDGRQVPISGQPMAGAHSLRQTSGWL